MIDVILYLIILIVCLVIQFVITKRFMLPKTVIGVLKIVKIDTILTIIRLIGQFESYSSTDKREYVVKELKNTYKNITGVDLPDSVANLTVEYIYNILIKKIK